MDCENIIALNMQMCKATVGVTKQDQFICTSESLIGTLLTLAINVLALMSDKNNHYK